MTISFCVSEIAVWTPGDDSENGPDVKDLPMMLRRRLSHLGKMAMRVAHDIEDRSKASLVFSSRYGESAQTVKLLQSLALKEPLSPAGFSMSVHNGLAGLLSITSKNKMPHSAISAGEASFCNALMEACAQLACQPDVPVLLVHYDEPLPDFYDPFADPNVTPVAVAMLLEKSNGTDHTYGVSSTKAGKSSQDAALSFVEYLSMKKQSWSWTDGRTEWTCQHAA